jgi:hypothetical protein
MKNISIQNMHITKDLSNNKFVYRLCIPENIRYELINDNVEKIRKPQCLLGVEIKIPKKKVVYDTNTSKYIDYSYAVIIYDESYLNEHTHIIDDEEKFQETHELAYKLLLSHIN